MSAKILPSEKIELAIYKSINKGPGPVSHTLSIPMLSQLTGESDHAALVERLKSLEHENRILLSKYQAGQRWPRSDSPDETFFYTGSFFIEIVPHGRKYFEELEVRAAQQGGPSPEEGDDRRFARLAIEEARKSVPEDDRVHPRVGAVIVKDGRVLATAHRGEILQCHAEYLALEKKLADVSLAGATVYTTLEPCTSRKHPKVPCAIRLAERKVARVVIGMLDPDDRISGRGQRALRKAGIATALFAHDLRVYAAKDGSNYFLLEARPDGTFYGNNADISKRFMALQVEYEAAGFTRQQSGTGACKHRLFIK
jgi:pyrimidine deaminase RibD-like protein